METSKTEVKKKNTPEGINSSLEEVEDMVMESIQAQQQKEEKDNKNGNMLREFSDIIKHNNIHLIGIPEREKREKGT